MIPYLNPDVLKLPLNDNFYILVNPLNTNGVKIINTRQADILNVINGNISIKGISVKFNFSEMEILKYLQSLVEKNIISFVGNDFKSPKWKELPKSLDLWVHTTNECTLKCNYCYISTLHNKSSMNSAVIFQLEKRLVELIKKKSINSLKIRLAGGEPLLVLRKWKTFVDKVYQIASKNHIRCKFVFLT
ncbi:MAG: uncharacterized protein QG588_20, partial [Candidatus Poribacteria bacterium]|nr:uncharacterized protein [Candidatus Poribacteria bacterium]